MATQKEPKIVIAHAAAAAIVTSTSLSKEIRAKVDMSKKFVVHPHVATVNSDDRLLAAYLRRIYTARTALPAAHSGPSTTFDALAKAASVVSSTRALAEAMADEMAKKNAKAGILFGFSLEVDGAKAHGLIKADLDDEQRFHFVTNRAGEWALDEVSDILPPPSTEFAKFAIAPQPGGVAQIGVLDVTQRGTAADYFLSSVLVQVPRTKGTKAAVAQVAARHGYNQDEIHEQLRDITTDTPVAEVLTERFPNVPQPEAERLRGTTARPMPTVTGDDAYVRTYRTAHPLFELKVDQDVDVVVNGRVITVTLPPDSDSIDRDIRPR